MGFTYTDSDKVILEAWGKFKATLYETVEPGDLLNFYDTDNDYTVQHADESSGYPANCIAMEAGVQGDEITCALKAVCKTISTIATGGVVTQVYFAGADDFFGAPLYLGEDGKPESSVGTTLVQSVGKLLARDQILFDLQPMFGADAKGVDWQVHGDLTANSIKWDSKINRLTIQKTFSTYAQIGSYDYAQYIGLSFGAAITGAKYIAGLKIAVEGAANMTGGYFWPLWIDFQNVGTYTAGAASHLSHIMLQVQTTAWMPQSYFRFHTASPGPEYLFIFSQDSQPLYVMGGSSPVHGGVTKKIKIDVGGTAYYLLASTIPV